MLSSSPLTEESVMDELKTADERCNIVAGEIKKLKEEMVELTNVNCYFFKIA